MKSRNLLLLLSASVLILIFVGFFPYISPQNFPVGKTSRPFDEKIEKTSKEIFKNKDALFSYVKKYGPKETIVQLNSLVPEYGSCHDAAHEAGHFAFEIYKDQAFKLCSSECHSGCYHGATESYFKEHGTANLSENLKLLCSSELNSFFSHQCLHGIGHGLMAWTDYNLPEALKSCELLSPNAHASCWTGVFMENIVGSSGEEGHTTKYLSEDPNYPCNIVEEKYKSSCYFLQTSRMVTLFKWDFAKVSAACLKAPSAYQRNCFESMGRDVGGVYRNNPKMAIKECKNAPTGELRSRCLVGAVQDTFWDTAGQDVAINFCKTLEDRLEKDSCYNTIFSRSIELLTTNEEHTLFCQKAEDNYKQRCLQIRTAYE